jgi:hypothetical protein
MLKQLICIAVVANFCLSATAQNSVPAASPKGTDSNHYIGLGASRSKHLLTYPFLHPLKAASKATFPVRHPLMAFEKFGKLVEPYQSGMNFLSAASGPVTSVGVFLIPRVK